MPQTFDNVGHCVFSIFCFAVRIQLAFSPAEARVVRAPVQVIKWGNGFGETSSQLVCDAPLQPQDPSVWRSSSRSSPFSVAQGPWAGEF